VVNRLVTKIVMCGPVEKKPKKGYNLLRVYIRPKGGGRTKNKFIHKTALQ